MYEKIMTNENNTQDNAANDQGTKDASQNQGGNVADKAKIEAKAAADAAAKAAEVAAAEKAAIKAETDAAAKAAADKALEKETQIHIQSEVDKKINAAFEAFSNKEEVTKLYNNSSESTRAIFDSIKDTLSGPVAELAALKKLKGHNEQDNTQTTPPGASGNPASPADVDKAFDAAMSLKGQDPSDQKAAVDKFIALSNMS